MTCCGRKRAMLYGAAPARSVGVPSAAPPPRTAAVPDALFEYTGETGVSAIGGVTRRLYRFDGKHARLAVDARDAPSMSAVSVLKRIA